MTKEREQGFKLGITGGIGSGKTSVCRVFDVLKVPVFSADREAREIMENNSEITESLNSIAGRNLYINGSLNRMELANIIFNDSDLLEKVNLLIHPVVFDHFRKWTSEQTAPYVIMEAAILFESGAAKFVDRVATVVAPVEQRTDRVIHRNKLSREQVMARMKNQMDDETRIKLSDYIIYNSENDMIIPAILKINDDILTYINNQS
jgi:dephospho-CoA kinase